MGATEGFELVERLTPAQVEELHALYRGEWWTNSRTAEDTRRIVTGSQVVLAYIELETGSLAAFARAVTDFISKALVLDVIVRPDLRGTGLGEAVMDTILAHPSLAAVRHFELYCRPELVPFYERWGFTDDLGELRFMRRVAPTPAATPRDRGRR